MVLLQVAASALWTGFEGRAPPARSLLPLSWVLTHLNESHKYSLNHIWSRNICTLEAPASKRRHQRLHASRIYSWGIENIVFSHPSLWLHYNSTLVLSVVWIHSFQANCLWGSWGVFILDFDSFFHLISELFSHIKKKTVIISSSLKHLKNLEDSIEIQAFSRISPVMCDCAIIHFQDTLLRLLRRFCLLWKDITILFIQFGYNMCLFIFTQ